MKILKLVVFISIAFLTVLCTPTEGDKLPVKKIEKDTVITKVNIDTSNFSAIEKAVHLINKSTEPMKGILLLEDLLKEDSTNYEAYFFMGKFYLETGQIEKAEENFNSVIAYNDTAINITYYYLGWLASQKKSNEEAIAFLNKYLEFDLKKENKQRALNVIEQLKNKQ